MMRRRGPTGFFRTCTIVIGCGVLTGLAVQSQSGPFAKLTSAEAKSVSAPASELSAGSLYPAPSQPTPIVQTIVVQDPPTPAAAPSEAWPEPESTSGTGGSGQQDQSGSDHEDQGGSQNPDD